MDKNNPALEDMYKDGMYTLNSLLHAQHVNELNARRNQEDKERLEKSVRNQRIALSRISGLLPEGAPDIQEYNARLEDTNG